MPFGIGPRNCIGMRFANEEIKIALTAMLTKFEFFPIEETPVSVYCVLELEFLIDLDILFCSSQEKIQFEPGYYPVAQPRNLVVGIRQR